MVKSDEVHHAILSQVDPSLLMEQHHHQRCKKAKKSPEATDKEAVDVIFLDIDGVLLPFGGDSGKIKETYADGCIFPDRTMHCLTSILQQMADLELPMTNSSNTSKDSKQLKAPKPIGNPKLVLSSTWRAQPAFIRDILSSFQCYAEANPNTKDVWQTHSRDFFDICDPLFHSTRHGEIYHWIEAQRCKTRSGAKTQNKFKTSSTSTKNFFIRTWIALDDEELVDVLDAYPDTDMHAVKTVSSVGLVKTDVDFAIKLVMDQMNC